MGLYLICVILHISTTWIPFHYNPLLVLWILISSHFMKLSLSLFSPWSDSSKNFFHITKLTFPHFICISPFTHMQLCVRTTAETKKCVVGTDFFFLVVKTMLHVGKAISVDCSGLSNKELFRFIFQMFNKKCFYLWHIWSNVDMIFSR